MRKAVENPKYSAVAGSCTYTLMGKNGFRQSSSSSSRKKLDISQSVGLATNYLQDMLDEISSAPVSKSSQERRCEQKKGRKNGIIQIAYENSCNFPAFTIDKREQPEIHEGSSFTNQ